MVLHTPASRDTSQVLASESYSRAHSSLVKAQQLAELEVRFLVDVLTVIKWSIVVLGVDRILKMPAI